VTVDAGGQQLMGIMRALDAAGVPIASIQLARPTLDDVFLTLTGRSLRDDSPSSAEAAAEPPADANANADAAPAPTASASESAGAEREALDAEHDTTRSAR
jgi:ABC-2 type transport system ATP-binding protein